MINIIGEKAMSEITKRLVSIMFENDHGKRKDLGNEIFKIINKENRKNIFEFPEEVNNE